MTWDSPAQPTLPLLMKKYVWTIATAVLQTSLHHRECSGNAELTLKYETTTKRWETKNIDKGLKKYSSLAQHNTSHSATSRTLPVLAQELLETLLMKKISKQNLIKSNQSITARHMLSKLLQRTLDSQKNYRE